MKKEAKTKLYKKLLKVRDAQPKKFRVHGHLRDNYPKLFAKLLNKFEVSQLKDEHLFQYLCPDVLNECHTCGNQTKFHDLVKGWKPFCSVSCQNNNPDVQEKRRQTNIDRRGVAYPSQCAKVRRKVVKTLRKNYGVSVPAQSQEVRDRMKATTQQRYGVDNASQALAVKQKKVATNLARTGGLYTTPFSNPDLQWELSKRSNPSYRVKVNGRKFHLQGYEDIALHLLRKSLRVPCEFISTTCKPISYLDPIQEKQRRYYPDFRVKGPSRKMYVEVKSLYTAGLRSSAALHPTVLAKVKAVVAAGYPMLLVIVAPRKGEQPEKGKRRGRITHYLLSTPERPDWELHKGQAARKALEARFRAIKWPD